MTRPVRVEAQPSFILHTYPFSETSLIAEVFSRAHGRVPVLARGARRPRSAMRGLIMAFQPLEISWSGKGEVRTLMRAEWKGGQPLLSGRALLCAYYLNELLVLLLPREDPHETIFDAYAATLMQFAVQVNEADIRRFEQILLQELGYGLTLDVEGDNRQPINANQLYTYRADQGAIPYQSGVGDESSQTANGTIIHGKTLLDMSAMNYQDARTLTESKWLMRALLEHHLGGKHLATRRIFKELLDK